MSNEGICLRQSFFGWRDRADAGLTDTMGGMRELFSLVTHLTHPSKVTLAPQSCHAPDDTKMPLAV
jgi:hypothetical protein